MMSSDAYAHLQCLDDSKENTAEEWRPYYLITKHLGDDCFITLGLVRIYLAIKESVPDMTCMSRLCESWQSSPMAALAEKHDKCILCEQGEQ